MTEENQSSWLAPAVLIAVTALVWSILQFVIERPVLCLIGYRCPVAAKPINGWVSRDSAAPVRVQEGADGTYSLTGELHRKEGLKTKNEDKDYFFVEINRCVTTESGEFRAPITTNEEKDAEAEIQHYKRTSQIRLINGRPDIYDIPGQEPKFQADNFIKLASAGRFKEAACRG